jgi:hypothetical protein
MSDNDQYDEEVTALLRKYQGQLRGFVINFGAASDVADDVVIFAFTQLRPHWARLRTGHGELQRRPPATAAGPGAPQRRWWPW